MFRNFEFGVTTCLLQCLSIATASVFVPANPCPPPLPLPGGGGLLFKFNPLCVMIVNTGCNEFSLSLVKM